jgi:hypothetical protein
MSEPDELSRMAVRLEMLRRSGEHGAWAKLRRLAIVALCCKEDDPLIEVMDTDPPCVFVAQAAISEKAITEFVDDEPREPWQGVGRDRGGRGLVWLSTFERMAGTNIRKWVWCRHHRWYISSAPARKSVVGNAIWIPLDDVLTKQGRRVMSVPDKPRHMG